MANEPVNKLLIAGEAPWRDNQVDLPENPGIDDVLAHPDIGFEVRTTQMFYHQREGGNAYLYADDWAVVRTDSGYQVGTVKKGYVPYQNSELFNLVRPAVEKGDLSIEMVGTIKGGRRIFCLAKINAEPAEILPGDELCRYICFGNGHDGSMSVFFAGTDLRTACTNVLATIMRTSEQQLRVQHSRTVKEKVLNVWASIDLANRRFEKNVELYSTLAKHELSERSFRDYVRRIFGKKLKASASEWDKLSEKRRVDAITDKVQASFESGRGTEIPGVRGTWWGAFNSVTEYLNYERGRTQSARFEGLLFGEGNRLAHKALRTARELALA